MTLNTANKMREKRKDIKNLYINARVKDKQASPNRITTKGGGREGFLLKTIINLQKRNHALQSFL